MPTVQGALTVADLVDGQTGATIVFSNESHTFVADTVGAIAGTELGLFSSTVSVFSGSTEFTYEDAAVPSQNNRWTIAGSLDVASESYRTLAVSPSSLNLIVRIADSTGTITIHDVNSATNGFVDAEGVDSAIITIPVVVQINGTDITYNRVISLSKALGGSAPYVRMSANKQTIDYAYNASAPKSGQGNLILTANSTNFVGTPTGVWSYQIGGTGSFTNIVGTNVTGHTFTNAATETSVLTVTPAGYNGLLGTNQVVAYRFTRINDGSNTQFDQISVFKLTDAEAGIMVQISTIGGTTTILKNNPSYDANDVNTYIDLQARIFRGGTELTTMDDGTVLTYSWSKNGTAIPASGGGSLQVTQPANYGRTANRIRLGGTDITDGGSESYSCAITY